MRRLAAALAALLICCCGCSASIAVSEDRFSSRDEALLLIDGETALTAMDYLFAEASESAWKKQFGGKALSGEELFVALAENAIAARCALTYGDEADEETISGEYEVYLDGMTEDTRICRKNVMAALGITDEEFKELYCKNDWREKSADSLVNGVARAYGNILDPLTMEEYILSDISEIAAGYDIQICFKGSEDHVFSYESLL